MWIHLNGRENVAKFVSEKIDENLAEVIIALSVPTQSHCESEIPRKCISPTLWQCCIGVPKSGSFYVYLVTVDNPIPADGTVLDKHITNEHWITKDVIKEFGEPTCDRIGRIEIDPKDVSQLKVAWAKNLLPKEQKKESDLWQKKGDLFVLNPGIMDRNQ
jgi:hypothetical protein